MLQRTKTRACNVSSLQRSAISETQIVLTKLNGLMWQNQEHETHISDSEVGCFTHCTDIDTDISSTLVKITERKSAAASVLCLIENFLGKC